MASIKIDSSVMRDKANSLQTVAKEIKGFTDEMTQEINKLSAYWEGNVAETTVKKFNALNDDFDERFNTINQYADFLNKAADEWDKVNTANQQNADAQY